MFEEEEFFFVVQEFLESSYELAEASKLCENDPIKQEMISFIYPQFEQMRSRSEGIRIMLNDGYQENKKFILEEMKKVTKYNYDMAGEIRKKLKKLYIN